MADLSALSTEELMRMRGAPPPTGADLSQLSTEDLMRMKASPEKPGMVMDVLKSLPGAVTRASAALVGIPETLGALAEAGGKAIGMTPARSFRDLPAILKPGEMVTKGYDAISEAATGSPVYRPQTGPGRVADLAAQTLVSGPGAIVKDAPMRAAIGTAAGTAGEGGRLVTDNPIALAVIQMLGGGVASLPFILRSVPAETINQAIKGITQADLAKAQSLMDAAKASGTPLTGAEAIAQVTGKNTLQDVQRVVEGSTRGGPVMQPTMNARPEANRAALGAQVDTMGPTPSLPAETPVRMQQAAETAITRARQAGNAAAGPDYAAAATQNVSPSQWNTLTTQPAAQKALNEVKRAAEWGVANEREGSIRWLDAAKRWIDAKIQNPATSPSEKRVWQQGLDEITSTADQASAAYRNARSTVAQNRQNVVGPMEASPVGDISRSRGQFKDAPAESAMRAQSDILMPQAPRALDPPTIHRTVSTLNKQDPTAARDFLTQNIRAIFDETTQNLVGGSNQWGGAKFAAQVVGNPRQKDNLQALVESAGGGRQAWVGFNRLLEVFEAQGKRLAPGSPTAQNMRLEGQLSAGGAGSLPAMVASPNRAMSAVGQLYDNFRFGKNTEEMARILTDPKSVDLMRQLAKEAPNTAKAAALVAQIIAGGDALADGQSSTNR